MSPTIYEDIPLAALTTYRIGGPARYFATPRTREELIDCLAWARERLLPWFLLGAGSNVLISDQGFPGLVLKLAGEFREFSLDENAGIIRAGSAAKLPLLSTYLARRGFSGFVFACGIPGTVGGALRMNAGTKHGEIKDVFVSAELLTPALRKRKIDSKEMHFQYRTSALKDSRDIVLEAQFRLGTRKDPAEIMSNMQQILADRKRRRPKIPENCGSVFKNPPGGRSAGYYIEQAGFKGVQEGRARVSPEHANWIVNLGNATAMDVKALILRIREAVYEKYRVNLERELLFIPEDLPEA